MFGVVVVLGCGERRVRRVVAARQPGVVWAFVAVVLGEWVVLIR
jgi:hypothetical protein